MAAFIQLSPDPYNPKSGVQDNSEKPNYVKYADVRRYSHVRRPQRGTQMKTETFATLEIKTQDGRNILLLDSGGLIEKDSKAYSAKYSNFLIQNVQRMKSEKNQIMETFGQSFIYLYGSRPNIYSFSGILFNSADFNWKSEFLRNYDLYVRATQCAIYRTSAYISYDDTILRGFIINSTVEENAENNEICQFSFQMVIADDISTSNIGDPFFSIVTSVLFGNEVVTDNTVHYGKISENVDEYIARGTADVMNYVTYEETSSVSKDKNESFLNTQLKQYGSIDKVTTDTLTKVDDKKFSTKRVKGQITKNTKVSDLNSSKVIESYKNVSVLSRENRKS